MISRNKVKNCIILTEGVAHAIVAGMTVITLLTDFGLKDGYVGVMKGVIWGISPDVEIADITHLVHPQNILEGALALGRTASFFPPGTIHVGVVDPGVGSKRRPIAARLGEHYFVGPDNGLCSLILEQAIAGQRAVAFVHLDRPEYWLPVISSVFHGRDIFSPAAAHLARGIPLETLGSAINDPIVLDIPRPIETPTGWKGTVIIVDHFGNLSTNLTRTHLSEMKTMILKVGGHTIRGLVGTFGDARPGELVALFGEAGDLSIAVVEGNASESLGVSVGETVEVLGG